MNMKTMKSVSVRKFIRLTVILLGFAMLSCCAHYNARWGPPTMVVEESKMKLMVEPEYNIFLNALPGKLVIKGTDNDYAELSMEVKCPDTSGPCADHFSGLEFDTKKEGNHLSISTNKKTLLGVNNAVKTMLALPRIKYLNVNMFAGNVNIYGIAVNWLDVDVWAGDVKITIPENILARIDLDAGVGDVSIRRPGSYENAPRSFLVGAEVNKFISKEGAIVHADVQFGNIRLNLTQ